MIRLDYPTYKAFVVAMADEIAKWKPDELICIMRGGMSASHIISRHLKLPVGVYYPLQNFLYKTNPESKKLVFIEDVISKGRTYQELYDRFPPYNENAWRVEDPVVKGFEFDWKFATVIIDGKIDLKSLPEGEDRIIYGVKTNHWLVEPYNETDYKYENLEYYSRSEIYKDKNENKNSL
jgi:hypoxanthine phosphoribosyltransferase